MEGFDPWRQERLGAFEAFLGQVMPQGSSFAEAMSYPVFSGGKRIRPLLCLASYEAVTPTEQLERVLPMAAAIELVHTYSLVHDDLPAMDDDDERRGRPTVHKKFGEATAVLVGDALLTHAFQVLADHLEPGPARASAAVLGDAAGYKGMIGGQVLDMGLAGPIHTVDRLTELHALKTGCLIRASCQLGGIAAEQEGAPLQKLIRYGQLVGLAFQLVDDILDAEEDAEDGGPPSFVKLLGIDETRRRANATVAEASDLVRDLPRPGPLLALADFTVARTV